MLAGRYELRSLIGRGGMAQVWAGHDQRLDRDVAVKLLEHTDLRDSTVLDRFDREARTVAKLSHPNIIAIHDVGTDHGTPFLIMELVEGSSLADLLIAGPVDPTRAVDIAMQVCDALTVAHAAGVVHRDVKPANILITGTGQVKVCDFGIAKMTGADQANLTASAQAIGTSAYMAPEQVAGGPVDARTDLYALGCVLYAMLTGQPPFTGDNAVQVAWQHLNQAPPPPSARCPGLPPPLDALIAALLAKQAADRPATAARTRADLAQLGSGPAATTAMPSMGTERTFRASAAVHQPTRTIPTMTAGDDPSAVPQRSGRIRPGSAVLLALAVAVSAVVVFALVLVVRSGMHDGRTAAPDGSTTASAGTPPAADTLSALKAAIEAQRRAGQLDDADARELTAQVDDIARYISQNDTGKAADKAAELSKSLNELRDEGKIGEAGYTAILAAAGRLTAALPSSEERD
ncbi:hypothetical protein GCM10010199_16650 [Dactylosporangium roseum]